MTTDRRKYGAAHRKLRAYLIAQWLAGYIRDCWRCGQPLTGPTSRIHLGHTNDGTAYAGLEHAACNIIAGNENRPPLTRTQRYAIHRRKRRQARTW